MIESSTNTIQRNSDDLLWRQLKTIPAFRALLRSVEARFYHAVELPQPILDVGCGDGHFAEVTFQQPITAGIDPWWGPLKKAQASDAYHLPMQAMGDFLPFADHTFASAFSNSVLEHIVDLHPVLVEVSRVLQPGAPFVLTVPSHYFTEFLGGAAFFEGLGLDGVADYYRSWFNRISRHAHTDPPELWAERLALAGFTIERWQYYFSREALRTLEIGHAQGLPSAVIHALTGHWILGPWEGNLRRTEQWVRPYYEEEFPEQGAYLFFLGRKTADEPVDAALPPPQPYTLAELESAGIVDQPQSVSTALFEETAEREPEIEIDSPPQLLQENEAKPATDARRYIIPGLLVALTLSFAFLGQSALRATPQEPADGFRWFLFSAICLLVLLWFQRAPNGGNAPHWHWPNLADIPKQRWLYLPAFLFTFGASRLASSPGYLNPAIPLGIWAAGIALAAYSLSQESRSPIEHAAQPNRDAQLSTLKISVFLFLAALIMRVYDLANHPFIINGTEASLGLEALNVLSGVQNNPFGTGWLTNPSLPFFFLAIPLRILGSSAVSLRLLSVLIGAVTVPILFVIAQRLYGRNVALVAAILLAGSHYHIHFSRSGLTNAWDALIVLLALGFIAIAWQKAPQYGRSTWLLAGSAVGFSAYLYTSSHLLPIMLLFLAVILAIFDGATLAKQGRHIIAMFALALIIALPQLLYYQSSPGTYTERANTLGIFDSQSGWLTQESARTGLSQLQLLATQFRQAALAFNATIDTSTSYGPYVPFLSFVFGILAVLGLILALIKLRQIRYSILVVWITVTLVFAGALLLDPPNSHRMIVAMPAVSILAAVSLNELVKALHRQNDRQDQVFSETGAVSGPPVFLIILLLVAGAVALYEVGFYFGAYRSEHNYGDRNTEIADGVAQYLSSLDGDWVAQFYGPPAMYVSFPTIPFLAGERFEEKVNLFDVPEGSIPLHDDVASNKSFIFIPERYGEIEQLRAIYPSGQERMISGYYADPLFYVFEVRGDP